MKKILKKQSTGQQIKTHIKCLMKTLQLWKSLGKLVKRNNMQVPKKTQQACLIVEKSCPGIATWHK